MALAVADFDSYCYGSQDYSSVFGTVLSRFRRFMLAGRRIICPQAVVSTAGQHRTADAVGAGGNRPAHGEV